jgi:hypothetical protein
MIEPSEVKAFRKFVEHYEYDVSKLICTRVVAN